MNTTEQRLRDAWRECTRHVRHLFHAMTALRPLWPFTAENYAALSDQDIQALDQFILRFTKLQDAMGERLLPAVLQFLLEPYDDRPMLDKLHRLEQLGFVGNADRWLQIRAIRNRFAHEYPDEPARNAANINAGFQAARDLYRTLHTVGRMLAAGPYALSALEPTLPQDSVGWMTNRP